MWYAPDFLSDKNVAGIRIFITSRQRRICTNNKMLSGIIMDVVMPESYYAQHKTPSLPHLVLQKKVRPDISQHFLNP